MENPINSNNQNFVPVSVIVPVYNGENFLAGVIQNICRQEYQPLEIIVVDDGSTDETAKVAAQFGEQIHYIYQSNQGPAAARNYGIKLAKGDMIAFLDVDDLWADYILGEFVNYLTANPDVDIVQGLIQRLQLNTTGCGEYQLVFEPYQFINLGSALYRKSVFDKVGMFDELLWDNEDTDWYMRAWELNVSKVVLPKIMLYYRKHDNNMTLQQKGQIYFGLLKIYKRCFERARTRSTQGITLAPQTISWLEYLGCTPD